MICENWSRESSAENYLPSDSYTNAVISDTKCHQFLYEVSKFLINTEHKIVIYWNKVDMPSPYSSVHVIFFGLRNT